MSSVVQFLETAGRWPMTPIEFARGVEMLDTGPLHKRALLDGDGGTLCDLLDGGRTICCMVLADENRV